MFEQLQPAPPDPILGLTEAFRNDSNPEKINLSVGVYKDAQGQTPILASVKEAEQRLLGEEKSKSYMPINGAPVYGERVRELMFGTDHEIVTSGRAVTAHTPGGTGALRVAGEFIREAFPGAKIWASKPTWANHGNIFAAAGLPVETYAYFESPSTGLAFDAMIADLQKIPAGDIVLLHGCCHNPSGVDPSAEQWAKIADVVYDRGLLPLLDFAYQGFGTGLTEDAAGLMELARPGCELLVCSSFSKNFSLYCERVGALTAVSASPEGAGIALSRIKKTIRANYSNPPAHGAAIISTILGNAALRTQWEGELAEMRSRINDMRQAFSDKMAARNAGDFSFITRQLGMFSFSGLTPMQVDQLRKEYSIYIVGSGRINVAGMTPDNIDKLCDAIVSVL